MEKFKEFYNKNNNRRDINESVLDRILELVKEVYSQYPYTSPEELFTFASEALVSKTVEQLNKDIKDVSVYALDEIKEKFPTKINIDNETNEEEFENERTKETGRVSSK